MAQKRLILVDAVPLSIKKSQVGTDRFPELVMFMTRNTETNDDMWLPRSELDGLSCFLGFHVRELDFIDDPDGEPLIMPIIGKQGD